MGRGHDRTIGAAPSMIDGQEPEARSLRGITNLPCFLVGAFLVGVSLVGLAPGSLYHRIVRSSLLLVALLAACAASPTAHDPELVVTTTGRAIASLQRAPHDPAQHLETCKVFHHVFAPDGRLLTKGQGGEFPHHRGLFLGWNQMQWRGAGYDFWHCSHGETQQFRDFLPAQSMGLTDDWQVSAIDWCVANGTAIVRERRALRARELGIEVAVLDVRSELLAEDSAVRLAGDPQHAGEQFRALQQFAEKDAAPVRYLRPASAVGEANDVWKGCEWIAGVLPMPGGDVTVLRVEGRNNPRPTVWSTRPYGRFGATFTTELQPGTPLPLSWTYVIALGARDTAWCQSMAAAVLRQ
jgi:hypothetical protein